MSELVATVEQRRGGATVIKLVGVIDEHNDLAALVERVERGKTLINLSGVVAINSQGMRDWSNWLASLEKKGIHPELVACSPAIVAQLNLVKGFAGHSVIKTLQAPYRCTACALDRLVLVNITDIGKRMKPPESRCEACGLAMTVVDETGTYFSFVADLPRPAKSDSIPPITPIPQQLARGSDPGVEDAERDERRASARPSALYLSAAQVSRTRTKSQPLLGVVDRPSQRQMEAPPQVEAPPVPTGRRSLVGIIGVLVLTFIVLACVLIAR